MPTFVSSSPVSTLSSWAIGLSSIGVDEDTYREIHVAFPRAFVEEWLSVDVTSAGSFHYISSSDISPDSRQMWARVKVEGENTLFDLARDTSLRVIAYRPDYIRPTAAERHLGQNLLYWFFAPLGVAVEARQIGEAMLEVAARGGEFEKRGQARHTADHRLQRGLSVIESGLLRLVEPCRHSCGR